MIRTPTSGETPGWIDEADVVAEESAVDRVEDGELGKSLNGQEKHEADDLFRESATNPYTKYASAPYGMRRTHDEAQDQGTRSTVAKRTTTSNEETCTDGASYGNHLHVSSLQRALQLALLTLLDVVLLLRSCYDALLRVAVALLGVRLQHAIAVGRDVRFLRHRRHLGFRCIAPQRRRASRIAVRKPVEWRFTTKLESEVRRIRWCS